MLLFNAIAVRIRFVSSLLFRGNYLINETPDICSGIARELRNRTIQRPSIQISFREENISFDPVSFPPFYHRIIISVHCLSNSSWKFSNIPDAICFSSRPARRSVAAAWLWGVKGGPAVRGGPEQWTRRGT